MKNFIYLFLSGVLAFASCSKDDPAPVEVGEVKLNKTTLTLAVGEEQPLTATVLPDNAENKTLTWISSNTKIATVSDAGLVKAVAVGSATITARAGGRSATCTVTVEPIAVESVTLDKTELTLKPGKSEALTATVLPDDAENKTVTWSSSDTKIASVNDAGLVTAVAPGSATITARAGGRSATCTVTVEPIAVESVTLDKTNLTLHRDDSETLTATVLPDDATDSKVVWTTSDKAIATVSDAGLVTAVAPGKATITATAGDQSATCTVTVEPNVYVVGHSSSDYSVRKGLLWKNGVPTPLPFKDAYSVFVSEGDVYVTGLYLDENNVAIPAFWKNGEITLLEIPAGESRNGIKTSSVFVSGGDVYVAGFRANSATFLWKNGHPELLATTGNAHCVLVSGQDVYVSGNRKNATESYMAAYWKNGTAVDLTDGAVYARVFSIAVAKGTVYAAGMEDRAEGSTARLWTDGVVTPLEGYMVYGIAVSEKGDVYIAGDSNNRKPILWKNGEKTELSNSGTAKSVFVYGDDVYVSGGDGNWQHACLWKNGVKELLPDGYEGSSVFVY